ncbi:hypothetical protein BR93DRAFT_985649 [Coniochaeta sp. PMI_546]|nr:hypothetical protein BR93DRAFT_985649 [Coniochaeta sp. PMI_546]
MDAQGKQPISRDEVVELLREQAEVFKAKLEMDQKDRDALRRQYLSLENALPSLEQNIQRTENLKLNLRELTTTSTERIDDVETAVLALKAQVANTSHEINRLYGHLTTQGHSTLAIQSLRMQHDHMNSLIIELEKQQARTNARHASEGSIACNCAHKAINEKMAKMATRMTTVEHRVKKALKKLPVTGDNYRVKKPDSKASNKEDSKAQGNETEDDEED